MIAVPLALLLVAAFDALWLFVRRFGDRAAAGFPLGAQALHLAAYGGLVAKTCGGCAVRHELRFVVAVGT